MRLVSRGLLPTVSIFAVLCQQPCWIIVRLFVFWTGHSPCSRTCRANLYSNCYTMREAGPDNLKLTKCELYFLPPSTAHDKQQRASIIGAMQLI